MHRASQVPKAWEVRIVFVLVSSIAVRVRRSTKHPNFHVRRPNRLARESPIFLQMRRRTENGIRKAPIVPVHQLAPCGSTLNRPVAGPRSDLWRAFLADRWRSLQTVKMWLVCVVKIEAGNLAKTRFSPTSSSKATTTRSGCCDEAPDHRIDAGAAGTLVLRWRWCIVWGRPPGHGAKKPSALASSTGQKMVTRFTS
ncbi:hypothetical protein B0H66DRAFT_346281 [Apodospora peruviana]|uniref:Uncharacterized protein n=1 Tax=Apodospora peruviana TaxID=516989 RepID=A0AAE0HZ38_9PEZI|nr:hypothetical protein B0H66DRAFT_346281 [Apodospora peruviana]